MKSVCVKHRDGWCATRLRSVPEVGNDNQATVCRHVVVFPWGYRRMEPTCKECKQRRAAQAAEGGR